MSDNMQLNEKKYTFMYSYGNESHVMTVAEPSIDQIIEAFKNFLVGCGFHPETIEQKFYNDFVCIDCADSMRKEWEEESGEE